VDLIYGRLHRQQERPQPLWLMVLTGIGSILILCVSIWATIRFFDALWTGYSMIPADRQATVGRLVALLIGVIGLAASCKQWRFALYHNPPMRELALTPGSSWQMLRVATRLNWFAPETRMMFVMTLMFYPFFNREFLPFTALFMWPGWDLLVKCFAALASIVSVIVLKVMIDKLALSLVLIFAVLGMGGGAPRFHQVASYGGTLFRAARFALVFGICFTIMAGLLSPKIWGTFGVQPTPMRLIYLFTPVFDALQDSSTRAHAALGAFPSVMWFDGIISSTTSATLFQRSSLGCLAWLAVGSSLIAIFHRRGLSTEGRGTWNDQVDAARPAEAVEKPARTFDPDEVSGPIEARLIARYGRMGRAALRAVSLNFSAGNIDAHLWRTVKLLPLVIGVGWVLVLCFPPAARLVAILFGYRLTGEETKHFGVGVACFWLALVSAYRLSIWETLEVSGLCNRYTMLRFSLNSGLSAHGTTTAKTFFGLAQQAPTRGDNLQPLTEIYALGFNDAVLIPVLNAAFWSLLLGGLLLIEGAALGVPIQWLLWTVGIAVPCYLQMTFLSMLNNLAICWVDYRRSRLLNIFYGLSSFLASLAAFGVIAGACGAMIYHSVQTTQHWIGWLGSLNALLLFNVGVFMLMRLIYVRRRFDAEVRKQGLFQK